MFPCSSTCIFSPAKNSKKRKKERENVDLWKEWRKDHSVHWVLRRNKTWKKKKISQFQLDVASWFFPNKVGPAIRKKRAKLREIIEGKVWGNFKLLSCKWKRRFLGWAQTHTPSLEKSLNLSMMLGGHVRNSVVRFRDASKDEVLWYWGGGVVQLPGLLHALNIFSRWRSLFAIHRNILTLSPMKILDNGHPLRMERSTDDAITKIFRVRPSGISVTPSPGAKNGVIKTKSNKPNQSLTEES